MQDKTDSFKGVMRFFATGVTVVTAQDDGGTAYGVTVNSFTSVSLEPQLILICLDNRLSGLERFNKDRLFAVNILAEDQVDISNHFATPNTDRSIASGLYEPGYSGVPLLKDFLAAMECRIMAEHPGGDHTILLAEVVKVHEGQAARQKKPLLYYRGRYSQINPESIPQED